jgi:hypothetical protein
MERDPVGKIRIRFPLGNNSRFGISTPLVWGNKEHERAADRLITSLNFFIATQNKAEILKLFPYSKRLRRYVESSEPPPQPKPRAEVSRTRDYEALLLKTMQRLLFEVAALRRELKEKNSEPSDLSA